LIEKTGIDLGTAMITLASMALHVIGQQGFVIRRESRLDCFTLARRQIDAKYASQNHEVAPGMAVTFGELIDELLDAGCGHGDDPFLFTLPQLYRFTERTFEQRLEVRCN
jgi:hypothetical protein